MADLTTTATAGAIMGLGLGVTLPVDGGMLFGALLGAWLATGTKQDLKAWSRLLSLILPTCVGYLFADVALARVPWLTNLAFCLRLRPGGHSLSLKAVAWVDKVDFDDLWRRIRGGR